jgi:MFS family permease
MRSLTRTELAVYTAIVITQYAAAAGITTVYSMLSHLYREFDDPLSIGWVVTGYWLVASVCAAIGGRLGDVFGRRRVAILMLAIAGCGSLISATATTLDVIIAGCALQGTTGVLTPLLIGMARENLPLEKMPLALGITTAAGTVSAGFSFFAAGYFIDHWSWHGGFYMKVAVVLLAIAGLLTLLPRTVKGTLSLAGVNLVAGVLFAPAIAGFFVAFQLAATLGWSDGRVWGILCGSIGLLVAWGWHQSRVATPLLNIRSLGHRQVLFANLAIGMLALGGMQHGQILSLLLQQPAATGIGFGLSATVAGLILLPLNAIALVASPLAGSLSGRLGPRTVAIIGSMLGVAGWTATTAQPNWFPWVMTASVVELFGLSMVLTAAYVAIVEATPSERTSEAMGISYVFLNVFIAIGGQSVFLLLATSAVKIPAAAGTFPSAAAFSSALGFVVAVAVVGTWVSWMLPRRPVSIHALAVDRRV